MRLSLLCAALLASSAAPRPAAAQERALEVEPRKSASDRFSEAERAFARGEFSLAAEGFEEAHRLMPHASSLWNAARAWHRAGEKARAANLYARYLREAPADAPDRADARSELTDLRASIGRVEIARTAPGVTVVSVDDRPLEGDATFVEPGSHVVRARHPDGAISRTIVVAAGARVSVELSAPPSPAPPAPAVAPSTLGDPGARNSTDAPARPRRRGWHPAVAIASGGVTALAAAGTVWSALDTIEQRELVDRAPTQDNLDERGRRQLRTNLFLGFTVSTLAFTTVALFLTDWGAPNASRQATGAPRGRAAIAIGPTSIALGGTF